MPGASESESAPGRDERPAANANEPPGRTTPSTEGARARRSRDRSPHETDNEIRPRRLRRRSNREAGAAPRESERREQAAHGTAKPFPEDASSSGKADSDPWTVPASVRERFHQEGHRFYFADGAPAFRDHGRKLSTPSENTELIASLIEIARARGWAEITVAGTDAFRREVWRQGRLAGLPVRGYRPSEEERVALRRALAQRGEERESERGAHLQSRGSHGVAEPEDGASRDRSPRRDTIIGKLLDHGREHYRFDQHQQMSYFVRIATPEGMRTIWGKDLERALEKSRTAPQTGDEVVLRRTGADRVTVKHRERDGEGKLQKETDLATHRNRWVIEKPAFFASRRAAAQVVRDPSIASGLAVRSHPELVGTYLNLHAAELAARRLRDPEDQKRFVTIVRGVLADAVARGEPLQPVRLRERPRRSPPGRPGREPEAPVR